MFNLRLWRGADAFVAVAMICLVSAGCSNSVESQVSAMNNSHIKQVANLYFAYRAAHAGAPPNSESDLKKFVKEISPHKLEMMHIDLNKLDDIFTSERDGKPFKIKPNVGLEDNVGAVVFEVQGRDRMREVGLIGPIVKLVNDDEYQKLWDEKGSQKSSEPASK
jgi:hypothetical protein